MRSVCVSARFCCREELESALSDLRRLGAVHCAGSARSPAGGAPGVVHVSVAAANASMARAILRRAGGELLPGVTSPRL